MKKLIPILLFVIGTSVSAQTTHTVSNLGFTFTPDTLYITAGDNVQFSLNSIHNAQEVSQATWQVNGSTSNGGFSVPFGGGTINIANPGTYYYVCTNHIATNGMKGIIIASNPNNIQENEQLMQVKAWPTKVTELLTVQVELSRAANVQIVVYDILGNIVKSVNPNGPVTGKNTYMIDCTEFRSGPYFVKVITGTEVKTIRIMK